MQRLRGDCATLRFIRATFALRLFSDFDATVKRLHLIHTAIAQGLLSDSNCGAIPQQLRSDNMAIA
jgi:hypothetical protein